MNETIFKKRKIYNYCILEMLLLEWSQSVSTESTIRVQNLSLYVLSVLHDLATSLDD